MLFRSLKDMFSPKAKRRKRLDKEIDKAMEFFEGKVLEYYPYVSGGDDLRYTTCIFRLQLAVV